MMERVNASSSASTAPCRSRSGTSLLQWATPGSTCSGVNTDLFFPFFLSSPWKTETTEQSGEVDSGGGVAARVPLARGPSRPKKIRKREGKNVDSDPLNVTRD